uniref:Uncharacterized protein n=1 Tax=Panagrolaimus davidi TaxID=227884 RepID=A0A914QYS4_9BILA
MIIFQYSKVFGDPMRLWNSKWANQFAPKTYDRGDSNIRASPNSDFDQKFNSINYSPQGMKDLAELQDLVGSADPETQSLIRPWYSMTEMTANGNRQGFGTYLHVLPDEEEGDKPIYSVGGSLSGGLEPAGVKQGYMTRMFG